MVRKFVHEEPKKNMLQRTRENNEGARRRHSSTVHGLATQYAGTDVRKYPFAVRVVDSWNQLLESVKMAQGKEAFKRGLRRTKHWEERETRLTHQRKLQNREDTKYNRQVESHKDIATRLPDS
jgi:hypothetical protein